MKDGKMKNQIDLLRKISKELYGDEWFIVSAIFSYKNQQEKTYTFFLDNSQEDPLKKYSWCQRPNDTNMSLCRFETNGSVCGYMSESLAEKHGLIQIDLNEFIHKFVKPLIKENIFLKEKEEKENKK